MYRPKFLFRVQSTDSFYFICKQLASTLFQHIRLSIHFMASPESEFITDQMLNPNGGLAMVF